MSANIIDGKKAANELLAFLKSKLQIMEEKFNLIPGIAIIIVGNHPASIIYVKNKIKAAKKIGINSFLINLPDDISEKNIIHKIENLNNDAKIHGILVQLPLPKYIDSNIILNSISPNKDVDGFHSINIGKLVASQNGFVPATAVGCLKLIKKVNNNLSGLKAVIIGRSNIVGRPVANLLINNNCTVTVIHSKSINVKQEIINADIIVIAIGSANFLKSEYVKDKAIIIDVGINKLNDKLTGDVDFDDFKNRDVHITPVPGGVGPMTIACLLENTVKAACQIKNIDFSSVL